jgi:hypothetical protein
MKNHRDLFDRNLTVPLGGQADGVDLHDPARAMMEREESADASPAPAQSEVIALAMAYLFGAQPHPERVTLRLYRLTTVVHPELLQALPYAERAMLIADDEAARDERVVALLRGTRISRRRADTHQRAISEVLTVAWDRQHRLELVEQVPESALTDYQAANPGELLSHFEARQAAVRGLLEFFFLDGPQPERAVKRVFMLAKAYFPKLVLRMSLHLLAKLFGQVRATWSWRGKKKLNGFLAARGQAAVKAPYQKSAAVCAKYALAATGNRNRATGRRVA